MSTLTNVRCITTVDGQVIDERRSIWHIEAGVTHVEQAFTYEEDGQDRDVTVRFEFDPPLAPGQAAIDKAAA